jgi:hypothetical protein
MLSGWPVRRSWPVSEPTKFEQDLKAYMPVIFDLYQLEKADLHIKDVVSELLEMRGTDQTGRILIVYNQGHIESIKREITVLAGKKGRPGY